MNFTRFLLISSLLISFSSYMSCAEPETKEEEQKTIIDYSEEDLEAGLMDSFYDKKDKKIYGACDFIKQTRRSLSSSQVIHLIDKLAESIEQYTDDISAADKRKARINIISTILGLSLSAGSFIYSIYANAHR